MTPESKHMFVKTIKIISPLKEQGKEIFTEHVWDKSPDTDDKMGSDFYQTSTLQNGKYLYYFKRVYDCHRNTSKLELHCLLMDRVDHMHEKQVKFKKDNNKVKTFSLDENWLNHLWILNKSPAHNFMLNAQKKSDQAPNYQYNIVFS
jgi:hypothetical protein